MAREGAVNHESEILRKKNRYVLLIGYDQVRFTYKVQNRRDQPSELGPIRLHSAEPFYILQFYF